MYISSNLKKYCVLTMILSFIFTLMTPMTLHAQDGGSLIGSGTKADPYLISSSSELFTFASIVDKDRDVSAKLMTDITVDNWSPMAVYEGSFDDAYGGVFDGNGKTITFNSFVPDQRYQGLFVYNRGLVKNLTIKGRLQAQEYAAGVVAINHGTIDNCHNYANIDTTMDVSFAGGIVGSNYGTITNSQNHGSITTVSKGSSIGGIAGAMPEGNIKNVMNDGIVKIETDIAQDPELTYSEGAAGGIVGINYKGIIDIANNVAQINNNDATGYTGGIAGLNDGVVSNALNNGSINGLHYVGGITGYLFKNKNANEAQINNSLNLGNVSSAKSSGAISGNAQEGIAINNYYLEGTSANGIPNLENGAIKKTQSDILSGQVTYLLNNSSSANPIWKQTIDGSQMPNFNSEDTVYKDFDSADPENTFTNNKPKHEIHNFDVHGACIECGYESIKVTGHSLTLDGSIGANFYFAIDPMYYSDDKYTISVEFTMDNDTIVVPFDKKTVLQTSDNEQSFGFTMGVDSDEMTHPIDAKLVIKENGTALYTIEQAPYRVYDYLLDVVNGDAYDQKLKTLATALATYDYHANEFFQYYTPYDPEITLADISGISSDSLDAHKWVIGQYTNEHTHKHYASILQFKTKTNLALIAQVRKNQVDVDELWLGYRPSDNPEAAYTYVQANKKNGRFEAVLYDIPSSQLYKTYQFAFFKKEDGLFKPVTPLKTGGAYSYIHNILASNSSSQASKNLVRSFYIYAEAARAYFNK